MLNAVGSPRVPSFKRIAVKNLSEISNVPEVPRFSSQKDESPSSVSLIRQLQNYKPQYDPKFEKPDWFKSMGLFLQRWNIFDLGSEYRMQYHEIIRAMDSKQATAEQAMEVLTTAAGLINRKGYLPDDTWLSLSDILDELIQHDGTYRKRRKAG